jgi:hypothetical protein
MAHSVEINTDAAGFVIRGYDPVAYFTEGRPVPGRSDLSMRRDISASPRRTGHTS